MSQCAHQSALQGICRTWSENVAETDHEMTDRTVAAPGVFYHANKRTAVSDVLCTHLVDESYYADASLAIYEQPQTTLLTLQSLSLRYRLTTHQ